MKINTITGPASSTFEVYVNGKQIHRVYISGEYEQRKYMTDQLVELMNRLRNAVTSNHIQVHRSWIQADDTHDRYLRCHLVRCHLMAGNSAMVSELAMVYHGESFLEEVERDTKDCLIQMLEKERYAKDESDRIEDQPTDRASAGDTGLRLSESGHQARVDEAGVDGGMHDAERPSDEGVH